MLPTSLVVCIALISGISAAVGDIDLCGNLTVQYNGSSIPWADLVQTGIRQLPAATAAYLRPDRQALLPWIYTLIILVIHLPVVIVRVVRWETVQLWCLLTTLLTVVVYAQAYSSTRFSAEQVLVWTPLLLLIDSGSMAQIFFLIIEDYHLWSRVQLVVDDLRHDYGSDVAKSSASASNENVELQPMNSSASESAQPNGDVQSSAASEALESRPASGHANSGTADGAPAPGLANARMQRRAAALEAAAQRIRSRYRKWTEADEARLQRRLSRPLRKELAVFIALGSLSLLVAIIVLQLLGVINAKRALNTNPLPSVRWCSPLFRPFGVAVRDGNCNIHVIDQVKDAVSKGISCINLPGVQQGDWLKGTYYGTIVGIVLEAVDICILAFVSSDWRPRLVRMRRPWCTMFCGVAVLAVMLIFGIMYAQSLPPGITQKVWVVISVERPTVFSAQLEPAGLRGAIIGWHDGLFEGWHRTYFGYETKLANRRYG